MPPRRRIPRRLDASAARELRLFIDNDAQLYRSQTVPIMANLCRKIRKGIYSRPRAVKLWRYLVDNGAKKYAREFGTGIGDAAMIFPGVVRDHVARELGAHFERELRLGAIRCD